jgi:hypothetical protein
MQRRKHDRGAEPDPLRPAGDPAERDERVVDAAVRIDCLGTDDDLLGGRTKANPSSSAVSAMWPMPLGVASSLRGVPTT